MAEKHLGRRVRQRPRVRLALHSAHQPEIRQFRVACRRDEHVGRLDVAVEELVVMQVAHALEHLRDVEARRLLVEVAATLHHGAQLAARHELRREVDVGARFEGEVAANLRDVAGTHAVKSGAGTRVAAVGTRVPRCVLAA
eukprot:3614847-Pleurochrysis_carterae.AAC.4